MIIPIGQWVLTEACKQVKLWSTLAGRREYLFRSISPATSFAITDWYAMCSTRSLIAGIKPTELELEITESVLLQDVDKTLVELKALKEAGVSLSIDDFGTGYSSLSYLKRFPIDTIKIDRSFVQDLHQDTDDAAICAAILAMSQQLGLNVVAEGVETREQLEFLRRHNCDHIQGYICSKPLPASEFLALLLKLAGKAANSDNPAASIAGKTA